MRNGWIHERRGPSELIPYFLFTGDPEPTAVFSLDAQGGQNFVERLDTLPGYDDRELTRATEIEIDT